jgi:hypothetical protein
MNIKKILFIILIVVVLGGLFLLLNRNSVPTDLERASISNVADENSENNSESENQVVSNVAIKNQKFVMTGYGPAGKFHDLTFKNIKVSDLGIGSNELPVRLSAEFDLTSVDTGIEALDQHLCSDDFFDCANNPNGFFTLDRTERIDDNTYKVFGKLNLRGTERSVSFDVKKDNNVYSGSFLISISQFGMNYVGVNDDVKIDFSFEI